MEPRNVVQWNLILFSLMGGASLLQVLLCAANTINSVVGAIVGQGFCHQQVCFYSDPGPADLVLVCNGSTNTVGSLVLRPVL